MEGHHPAPDRLPGEFRPCPPRGRRAHLPAGAKRARDPGLYVRPTAGWYPVENGQWRWTAKRFGLEVTLPREGAREFALRFNVPEILLEASPLVQLTCRANGHPAGSLTCTEAETIEFRGCFPEGTGSTVALEFEVTSSLGPMGQDRRDLGVIIPLDTGNTTQFHRIPFRIS